MNPITPRNDDGTITYVPMAALSENGMSIGRHMLEKRQKSTSVRFRNGDTLFARTHTFSGERKDWVRPVALHLARSPVVQPSSSFSAGATLAITSSTLRQGNQIFAKTQSGA